MKKIRPPKPSEPKPTPSVNSRTLACSNCGEPYVANPPDDYHSIATMVRTDFSSDSTCVEIPYSCRNCDQINIIFWHNQNRQKDNETKLHLVYPDTPNMKIIGKHFSFERQQHTHDLICKRCKSNEFSYVTIHVIKDGSDFATGDALSCHKCDTILGTVALTRNGGYGEASNTFYRPSRRTLMDIYGRK